MEQNKFISKILPIFINAGFGVEKFDDTTYDIIDRSIIGKAKIGSIKVLDNGDLSVKIGGEAKKHYKFNELMKNTSFKAKPINNAATIGKIVKNMLNDYKKAKKIIYKESYENLKTDIINEVSRDGLETAIDSYLRLVKKNQIEATRADLLTYVSDKLTLNEDECEATFGDVLDLCLDYDENQYNNTISKLYEETDLKSGFRHFVKTKSDSSPIEKNDISDLVKEIKEDKALRRYRETEDYKNLDKEGKFRKLQKYVLNTHGGKFSNTDDLNDVCHEIATEDEEIF